MHMALDVDSWMRLHTSYCHRLSAWLSPKACDTNRIHSASGAGDLRCSGCNGLHDQGAAPVTLTRSLQSVLEEVLEPETAAYDLEEALLDGPCSCIDEDALDDEMLRLFPEFQELIEEVEVEEPETSRTAKMKPELKKKYAVFGGRCRKCNSYMVNDIERFGGERDDEVYRCFTCGWRVSPAYVWNRNQERT